MVRPALRLQSNFGGALHNKAVALIKIHKSEEAFAIYDREPNRADSIIQIRGAREARRKVRLPGEHGISRPTIAEGRVIGTTFMLLCVSFCVCVSRCGPRVRGPRPAFPAPSWIYEGGMTRQSSGETRRENVKACPAV